LIQSRTSLTPLLCNVDTTRNPFDIVVLAARHPVVPIWRRTNVN